MRNLLASLFILATGSLSAAEPPRVFNPPDSPLAITSFEVAFAGDAPVVTMRVRNLTAEVVEDAIFELFAFTAGGEIDAVYSFSAGFPIAAGGEILLVRRGELLDLNREQRVVATPALALYSDRRWEIPRDTAAAVAGGVMRRERGPLGVVTPRNLESPGVDANLTCDIQCARAQTRCDITCSGGGVKEFSCACDPNGGISTKCSCYARPK